MSGLPTQDDDVPITQIHFSLPFATPLLNKWQRMHWSERRRYVEDLAWHVKAVAGHMKPPSPLVLCAVRVERFNNAVTPDWDGLYGGMKALLDVLCAPSNTHPYGLGFYVDDNPECVVSLTCAPMKGAPETRVYIADLTDTPIGVC